MDAADRARRDAATRVPLHTVPQGALELARYALGGGTLPSQAGVTLSRHLAFLPNDALTLDLDDPMQRDFGDYELTALLGQGGMGVVYRARQKGLDRDVAVKLLAAGPWASADFIERFRREAQSAARMTHPNIVPIYEIGQHAEINFFSMRLVEGPSLASVLEREGPMAPKRAAAMLRTIAEAVDYAHRLGVLHLDLKPGNVLVDPAGEPQVADFGLARRLDETLSAEATEVSGTPSYMAPEQAELRRHRLSPATDIWGLGAILYEMLTGRPPFLAANAAETLRRVVTQEPERPSRHRDDVPVDLEAICLKCLAKNPAERYASARALADDLGRYCEGRPVSVRPLSAAQRIVRWARREPQLALTAGAFVFALVAGLTATAVQWRRADANADAARERAWVLRGQAAQAALAEGDGFHGLRDLVANLGEMQAVGATAEAAAERQRIGTLLEHAPRLIDLVRVEQGLSIHAVALAPDGETLAVTLHDPRGTRSVRAYDVATGTVRWTTSTDAWTPALPWVGMPHGWLRWTGDGSRLLVTMPHQSPFPYPRVADSMPLDARSGTLLAPPFIDETLYDLVASDDARIALVRWRADSSHRFPDSGQFYRIDGWEPVGPRHQFAGALQTDSWLPAPDGSAWLGTSGSSDVRLHELGSLAVRWRIALPPGDMVRGWRYSADGRHLALGSAEGRVLLVDPVDGRYEFLRATPAAPVRWLEFDADARTLAARAEDGTIAAWDVATRAPRVTPIAGPAAETGAVHVVGDTLFAAIGPALHAWSLPPRSQFDNAAVAAPARIRNRRSFAAHAFAVHAPSRLLAAAGTDGTIGLWRLPPASQQAGHAAPLPTRTQHFDGRSLVAVDGHRVQLRAVFSDAPMSPAWHFPDPVRLAERSHDGQRLAVVAGRTLRVLDMASGALVGAPIVLPQSPLRADQAAAAPVLVLTTGEYAGDTFRERIHVVDLEKGVLRFETAAPDGLVHTFRLDPTGSRLLIGTWRLPDSAVGLAVLALDGTTGCPSLAPDGINFPGDVAFADDGRTAWMYASMPKRQGALLKLDLTSCSELARLPLQHGGVMPGLLVRGNAVYAHRQTGDMLTRFAADGSRHDVPGMTRARPQGAFALDATGRRAVVAARNAVQLIDLERGEHLSGLLAAPIAGDDAIVEVMFAPDGGSVLARTFRGRWLAWRVPATGHGLDHLQRLATVLEPRNADAPLAADDLATLRIALRSDAEASAPPPRTWPDLAFEAAPAAQPDPRFVPLDLAPAINAPLNSSSWPARGGMGGDTPTLPMGPQRLLGIDWRVDGGVQLSWGGAAAALHPTQRMSASIPVPGVQARRVHALMLVHIPVDPRQPPSRAATVVLGDAAGKETPLEVQMLRDVVTRGQPGLARPSARIGWLGVSGTELRGGTRASDTTSVVYAVSLDVPAGTGPVQSLRLETRDGPMEAPLFYAVTLERHAGEAEREPSDSPAGAVNPSASNPSTVSGSQQR